MENRLKYTCAIFKCLANTFTNCLHITWLVVMLFCWFVGRHKFQFAIACVCVCCFSLFWRWQREKSERIHFFFLRDLTCAALVFGAHLIWGSLLLHSVLPSLKKAQSLASNHGRFFMCYLHTIYSDFPQFKINYVSLTLSLRETLH